MTMLALLDALLELLAGQRLEGLGPVAVEKYRRWERAAGPAVYLSPLRQEEQPLAIGGQYGERLQVEVRCEIPWTPGTAQAGDLLLRMVEQVLEVLEAHREVGPARRGRVGTVEYLYEQRRDGSTALVAIIPLSFTVDKS
jgi:hypothetical protein